jgi:hypothetical protein
MFIASKRSKIKHKFHQFIIKKPSIQIVKSQLHRTVQVPEMRLPFGGNAMTRLMMAGLESNQRGTN